MNLSLCRYTAVLALVESELHHAADGNLQVDPDDLKTVHASMKEKEQIEPVCVRIECPEAELSLLAPILSSGLRRFAEERHMIIVYAFGEAFSVPAAESAQNAIREAGEITAMLPHVRKGNNVEVFVSYLTPEAGRDKYDIDVFPNILWA